MDTLSVAVLEHVLATLPGRRVGLFGDLFLDRYLDIDAGRDEPSVETGLTAYQVVGVRNYPGALGTVLNNLVALGVGAVHPITFVGDDGEGYDLLRELRARPGVVTDDIVVTRDRRTPTYTKPMYGTGVGPDSRARELHRLDIKNRTLTSRTLADELLARLSGNWAKFDAVIVLDQVSEADCGVVTARGRDRLAELAAGDPAKFVLADSRERIGLFRGVCVKPNEREAGGIDLTATGGRPAFATLGERGLRLLRAGEPAVHVPAYPVAGPVDICGAGDSCSAGIAAGKACGLSDVQAAMLGNLVASVTVQQIGVTGTCTPAQLRARWAEVGDG